MVRPAAALLLIALLLIALLLLAGCGSGGANTSATADGEQASSSGLYTVQWSSESGEVPLNTLHSWTLHVEDSDGAPVANAQVAVDGGMPAHDHGLPTQPSVRAGDAAGDYLLEGLKFQMPGEWVITVTIDGPAGADEAILPLIVKP
jgi:hypothetical protein